MRQEQIRKELDKLQREFSEVKSSLGPKADALSGAIVEYVRQFNSRVIADARNWSKAKVISLGVQGVKALKEKLTSLDNNLPTLIHEEVMQLAEWPHRSATFEAEGVSFPSQAQRNSAVEEAIARVMGNVWTLLMGTLVQPNVSYGAEYKFYNVQSGSSGYRQTWQGNMKWWEPPLKEAFEAYREGVYSLDKILKQRAQLQNELTSLQAVQVWGQS